MFVSNEDHEDFYMEYLHISNSFLFRIAGTRLRELDASEIKQSQQLCKHGFLICICERLNLVFVSTVSIFI